MTSTALKLQASNRELDARDLGVMRATASAHARKLSRSFRLSLDEQNDVEQDILVTLLERWHYFDDARGSNIAFAIRIARQALHAIAGRIIANREIAALDIDFAQDVDDPSGEVEALTIADTLPDDAAPTEAMILDACALGRFLEGLPQDYALVAQAIREQDGDLAEAQRLSALSTTEFYRRLRELRYRLVCLELAPRQWLQR
ncbi:sigma factor [Aestuariivirga sp.]|uniref:sigma factor n=1 Tax=Aestuariivirga sp. TaxID=2650926 RepID=UPI0037835ACA